MEEIAREERDAFRKTLSPERRAAMAIGVIVLNWAYFDSDLTAHIFNLRGVAGELGHDVSEVKVMSQRERRVSTLRRLIILVAGERSEVSRKFDLIMQRMAALTELRSSIAHGLQGLGNPTGEQDDLRLVVFSNSTGEEKHVLEPGGMLDMPRVNDVFDAADKLWDTRMELFNLVFDLAKPK
jgi:hypothetical protein